MSCLARQLRIVDPVLERQAQQADEVYIGKGRQTDWRLSALDDLVTIDRFRRRKHLPAIRGALFSVIEGHFALYADTRAPLPGASAFSPELAYTDLRKTRVYVGKTGGPYLSDLPV